MLCIRDPHTDAYFNLAAEEYVLRNFTEDCFMLWRNEPSVIVGKHQNTLAEINLEYIKKKQIKVVRRLSGGGAVFHDLGNLNFTFIVTGEDGKLVNFQKFTQPILEVLKTLTIDARFEGRNDLTIDGKKISGNAEHVMKNRTLHHGTLLFSSEMADLSGSLKANPLRFKDKAVKSIRSGVTNISEYLEQKMDVIQFRDLIMDHIMETFEGTRFYEYTPEDILEIEKLRNEKYAQWEWNFGYSPMYKFEKLIRTNKGNLVFHLNVEKGNIRDIKIHSDFFHRHEIDAIEKLLTGMRHDPDEIREYLSGKDMENYFKHMNMQMILEGIF